MDQVIVWRDLGFIHCVRVQNHHEFASIPEWAQKTLKEHEDDPRPYIYTFEEFENAQTHDELWNAAQRQLRTEGMIHNYLRMLWGKKILEWTPTPEIAMEYMVALNDKWALDGRDPNTYTGIGWVLGKFDRGWTERPVYGKIRCMTTASTKRKFSTKKYIETYSVSPSKQQPCSLKQQPTLTTSHMKGGIELPLFVHKAKFDANKKQIWDWYNSDGAFRRIMPEWEGIQPINAGRLVDGDETIFKVKMGPLRQKWVARHHSVVPGESFADRMIKGPFGAWNHHHEFESNSGQMTSVIDNVEYKLPLHIFTGWSAGFTVLPRMKQMFEFRSVRVANDLKQIQATVELPRQRILVSGSTGMIGLQLCAFLEAAGHDVHRLLRPTTKLPSDVDSAKVVRWNDLSGEILEGDMNGFDSIIHLAGAGIGDKRWSKKRRS